VPEPIYRQRSHQQQVMNVQLQRQPRLQRLSGKAPYRLKQSRVARHYGFEQICLADFLLSLATRELNSPMAIWTVTAALLLGGIGCAMFNAQITAAAISAIPPERAATASAVCVTMRQIGFAIGIALIGSLVQRNDTLANSKAFAVVSALTLGLAAIVFASLRMSEIRDLTLG
jgi:predicted MFS family arabinose efflux permease